MDIRAAINQILVRASLIELSEAIKTADKLGDKAAKALFMGEVTRRLGDE